jgi:hypothetical protein
MKPGSKSRTPVSPQMIWMVSEVRNAKRRNGRPARASQPRKRSLLNLFSHFGATGKE